MPGNVEQIILRITGDSSSGERTLERMTKRLRAFGAAVTAVSDGALIAFYKLGKGGAELEDLERKFASVAKAFGQDMDSLLDKWQEAARGAISRAELMRKANYLALTGIPLSELEWMLQAVMNASAATGRSMEDLFDRLALGLARNSKLLLDDLGIIIDVAAANEEYAASIGKAADDLTEYDKKLAFMQAARQAAIRQEQILGKATESSAIAIQRARASLQDAADTIKKAFAPIVGAAANVVSKLAKGLQAIPEPVLRVAATLATMLALLGAVVGPILTVAGLLPIIKTALAAIGAVLPYLLPVLAVVGALGAAVALLAKAWRDNWGGIQDTVREVLDTIRPWIDAIIRNALGWIRMIKVELRGIVEAIRALLEPALERLRQLFGDGLGVKEFMRTLRDLVSVIGSLIYGVLSAIRMILEGNADKAYMPLRNAALNAITFMVLVWRRHIKDAATYGWNLIVNFANGIVRAARSVLAQVATWVGNMIARFWAPGSPPKEGPLSNIVRWGKGIAETFLRAFGLADFSILRDTMAPVRDMLRAAVDLGEMDEPTSIRVFRDVRDMAMELIAEFRKTGEISDEVLGNIADRLGEGGEEYAKYLRLQLEHQQSLDHLRDVEKRVAEAREAGFVPQALKDELAAAEEDVEKKKEAVDWQREYLSALQDGVDLQRDLVAALQDMAEAIKGLGKEKPEKLEGSALSGGAGAGEGVGKEAFEGFAGFSEEFGNVRQQVEGFFQALPGRASAYLQVVRASVMAEVWALLAQLQASPVGQWFINQFQQIKTWFETNWPVIQALALTAWVVIRSVGLAVADVMTGTVWPQLKSAFDGISEALAGINITWPDVWKALGNAVKIVAVSIAAILVFLVGVVTGIVTAIAHTIDWLVKTAQNARQGIGQVITGIVAFVLGLWEVLSGIFTGDIPRVLEGLRKIAFGFYSFIEGLVRLIVVSIQGGLGALGIFIAGFVQGFIQFFVNLYNRLVGQSIVPEMMEAIYNTITGWMEDVLTWFGEKITSFYNAGRDLIGGFLSGLQAKWVELKTWFQNRLSDIPDWAKKIFGIGSPSKLFFQYGQWMIEGFEKGFDVSRILDKVRSIAPGLNVTAGGLGGQQIYVVQIGDLSLPDVRDGRDAQSLLRELLERASGEAALRGAIPGGLMG